MLAGSLDFYVIADGLIRSIHSRIDADGIGDLGRVGVVDGAISWDDPECGLLVIAPVRTFLSETFPEPVSVGVVCEAAFVVTEYAIQIIRCAPTGNDSGNPPSVDALDRSARRVFQDAALVQDEVANYLCTLKDANGINDYITQPAVWVGPTGGAVGSEVHVHVALLRGGV